VNEPQNLSVTRFDRDLRQYHQGTEMLHHLKDLSPDQRRAVENLLGHRVADDESVSIKSIRPAKILPPQLSPGERDEALEKLRHYFAKVDAQRQPMSEAEEEEIMNEALRTTRPNYRPVG
jgi:hypothetical protein